MTRLRYFQTGHIQTEKHVIESSYVIPTGRFVVENLTEWKLSGMQNSKASF